jgi:O-antigen/teichoic acid export membrane protein
MSFVNNARILLIGFALAQFLPLLASPLLARLFSPEAFGLQTLFISWATVLSVVATLRLDLATVLAGSREEALRIVGLALLQACLTACLVITAVALFGPALAHAVAENSGFAWLWALAPMALGVALVQVGVGLLTWLKRFGPASQAQVLNQFVYLAVAIALGLAAAPVDGLVIAKLAGQAMAAAFLTWSLRALAKEVRLPRQTHFAELWKKCRPFLFFNTPYSLVGVIGREVPIFAFAAVAQTASAGHYGLARTLLGAPAALLAASLSQVFYREATEHTGTQRIRQLTVLLLRTTMEATAPIFAFILVWGDIAFAFAFGPEWATAGQFAMILSVAAWLALQTSWPERLYESVGKQGVSFAIQISFDALAAVAVFTVVLAGAAPILAVAAFALINSLFHICYLTGMFKVAGFPLQELFVSLARGAGLLALVACMFGVIRNADIAPLLGLFGTGLVAVALSGTLVLQRYRTLRLLTADQL